MKIRLLSIALGLAAGGIIGHGRGPKTLQPTTAPNPAAAPAAVPRPIEAPIPPTPTRQESGAATHHGAALVGGGGTRIRQLIERLAGAAADEFPTIWEEALAEDAAARERMETRLSHKQVTYLIMHEWVSRDAAGAWDYIQSTTEERGDGADGKLETFMTAWLAVDPEAAIAQLTASSWGELDAGLCRTLARHDPQLALQHWRADAEPGSAVPSTILREIAAIDPHAAFELLTPAGGAPPEDRALASISRGWPIDRLDEFLPRLAELHAKFPSTDLEMSYRILGGQLATLGDLDEGLDWILSLDDAALRGKILHGMLQQQQPLDREALMKIGSLPHGELLAFDNFKEILGADMEDRAAAWDWLQSLDPEIREKALSSGGASDFARNWALHDLDAAFRMIDAIPQDHSAALEDLAEGLARASGERHPQDGLALADQLPPELRSGFAQTLAKHWSGYDAQGFLEHIASMPDGPQLEALQRGGFKAIAAQSPEHAGELLLGLFDSDVDRAQRAGELVHTWILHDPGGAADWVARLPDGLHDPAASALGGALSDSHPAAAAQIFLSMRDPRVRAAALQQHFNHLAEFDRGAARRLAQDIPMGQAIRQEVLDGIDAGTNAE